MAEERALKTGAANTAGEPAADAAEMQARRDHVEDLRRRIDELDEALVRLLSARAACALEVGRAKKLLGLEIYQPSREVEVLAHVQRLNTGPLNDAAIKRLFERIIDEARRLEREADVKREANPNEEDDNAGGQPANE
ncbi:MAG: chorismate mutase [Vicinamibacterales bacterium]